MDKQALKTQHEDLVRMVAAVVPKGVDPAPIAWDILTEAQARTNCLAMVEDLCQEALIELMALQAKDRYDPAKGSYQTYAYHWIRQAVRNFHRDNLRDVRVFRGKEGRAVYSGRQEPPGLRYAPEVVLPPETPDGGSNPLLAFLRCEKAELVRAWIGRQHPTDQAILWAIAREEPLATLTDELGVSRQRIHQRASKLRKRGKRELKRIAS